MSDRPLTLTLSPQAGRGDTPSPASAGEGWGRSGEFGKHAGRPRSGCPMQRAVRPAREGGLGIESTLSINEVKLCR